MWYCLIGLLNIIQLSVVIFLYDAQCTKANKHLFRNNNDAVDVLSHEKYAKNQKG